MDYNITNEMLYLSGGLGMNKEELLKRVANGEKYFNIYMILNMGRKNNINMRWL